MLTRTGRASAAARKVLIGHASADKAGAAAVAVRAAEVVIITAVAASVAAVNVVAVAAAAAAAAVFAVIVAVFATTAAFEMNGLGIAGYVPLAINQNQNPTPHPSHPPIPPILPKSSWHGVLRQEMLRPGCPRLPLSLFPGRQL